MAHACTMFDNSLISLFAKVTMTVCAYRLTSVSLSRLPTSCGPLGPYRTSRSSISLTCWLVKLLQSYLDSIPRTWPTSYGLMPGMLRFHKQSHALMYIACSCHPDLCTLQVGNCTSLYKDSQLTASMRDHISLHMQDGCAASC